MLYIIRCHSFIVYIAPSAPTNLEIVRNFATEIELRWKRPSEINGELMAYVITGRNGDELDSTEVTTNLDSEKYLTGLKPGQNYTITVSNP